MLQRSVHACGQRFSLAVNVSRFCWSSQMLGKGRDMHNPRDFPSKIWLDAKSIRTSQSATFLCHWWVGIGSYALNCQLQGTFWSSEGGFCVWHFVPEYEMQNNNAVIICEASIYHNWM